MSEARSAKRCYISRLYLPDVRVKSKQSPTVATGRRARRIRRTVSRREKRQAAKSPRLKCSVPERTRIICRGSHTYTLHCGVPIAGQQYYLPGHQKYRESKTFVIPERVRPMNSMRFEGAATDTGAQTFVMGLQKARACCHEMGVAMESKQLTSDCHSNPSPAGWLF